MTAEWDALKAAGFGENDDPQGLVMIAIACDGAVIGEFLRDVRMNGADGALTTFHDQARRCIESFVRERPEFAGDDRAWDWGWRRLNADDAIRKLTALTHAQQSLPHIVAQARQQGATWQQVAVALGVSKQAAQQRFGSQP